MSTPEWDPFHQTSDVIVVGTGPGGATLGQRLAAAGRRVLFCELGGDALGPPLLGAYPELADRRNGAVLNASDAEVLKRAGRYTDTMIDAAHPRRRETVPFIGSGPGGSSSLYGMVMERLLPRDFETGDPPAGAPGTSAVAWWPISYRELAPYYAQAEALYRVRGQVDPLATWHAAASADERPRLLDMTPLTPAASELAAYLTQRGLHPYQAAIACEVLPACGTCQGVRCPRTCKLDAARVSLEPALADHGAQLLTGCRVLTVTTEGRKATGVTVAWRGGEHSLRASLIVLAAGALQTPLILLRSGAPGGPGLGNAFDQVGRHLMRHFIDLYLIRPELDDPTAFDNRRKDLAFNDLYVDPSLRLGTVQSFGRLPPAPMLYGALRSDVAASRAGPLGAAVLPWARPFLMPVLRGIEGANLSLAPIVEDLPYADHRVLPVAGDVTRFELHYAVRPEAQRRVGLARERMREILRGRRWKLLPQADNNQRIAHACGTCRFGDDPHTSVLDRDNRVHDVDNLFVSDASFFPSSGGTNPTLTIVANALRVADRILTHG